MIQLPRHIDNKARQLDLSGAPIVIIGANGAGKSRFTNALEKSLGDKAFALSALHGLYVKDRQQIDLSSVGRRYATIDKALGAVVEPTPTELDLLISMLLNDEVVNLLNYKINKAEGNQLKLTPTKLDKVIDLWQEIFPGNKILVESGRMMFGREEYDADQCSSLKLSDGEKAVIYYIVGVLYAPQQAAIFINSPEMFMHPSILSNLWNRIELLRPDCTFIYTTHDLEFASSRQSASVIWVRSYNPTDISWDYTLLDNNRLLSEDIYQTIIGARKPVLFIEGDGVHSIDAKLYPLIFKEFTVKSLGSCNKVIEATRTFNDLNSMHHLDSYGIVDRDRRDGHEVSYLRGRRIMVPDVAEIENILMLEDVIKAVAASNECDQQRVFDKVSHAVIKMFESELHQQALMHTRHKVKRFVEYRIDRRFTDINMLEQHIKDLHNEINPRKIYESLCREFRGFVSAKDYASILRVYNQKTMITTSNLPSLCKLRNKDEYIARIIEILKTNSHPASQITKAIKSCFGLELVG